ncbi:CubicO group peptidase (beta-lactamase class C family) [Inhella inkyongensis]|uniref:CubicO group peptidase (Beta-lactamase class C family) n=1 Tax=Inhella inkyongensis TaxID=392593 RepID=A0A840S9N9_9BURK|nr:serine hydrolase domain-containing protein [Inhella inkyongensis]MBB5205504.1 CubicO group peptidase (beta-lactamase class C family) [Inhella inkyongensis]
MSRFLPHALFLALSPVLLSPALAAPAQTLSAYAEQLLDEQGIKKDGPGLTLLVAQGDKLLYQGARGMASVELGVPLKPEHRMRLGSITKQFAAATLLKLIDEGKASLDDRLSKFLPDYPNGQAITLAQLLNHSSGVKSYTGIAGYMVNPIRAQLSTAELVKVFKDLPVDFAPGQQYRYNNSGYVLVGAVIEALSGKSWHQTLDAALLKPQRVDVRYPGEQGLIAGQAQGYSRGESGELATAGLVSMTQPHAAGALVGNVESLWRWNQALHGGKLLQPASYQRMVTPEGAAQGARYGFGIGTDSLRGQLMLQHGGGIHGFSTLLVYQPEAQLTVALLSNSDSAGLSLDLIARKLAAKALGKPYPAIRPVKLDSGALQAYEGVYSADGGKLSRTLRVIDGVLTSTRTGSRPIKLTPLGGDRFAFEGSVAQAQIERSAQGATLAYYPDAEGQADRWAKVAELPQQLAVALKPAELQALVGEYVGAQIRMRIFLDEQGRLKGQVPGQPVVSLTAQSARELQVVEVDARLSFSAEPDKALSVTLKQGGAVLALTRQ